MLCVTCSAPVPPVYEPNQRCEDCWAAEMTDKYHISSPPATYAKHRPVKKSKAKKNNDVQH